MRRGGSLRLNFDASAQEPSTVALQELKENSEQRAKQEQAIVELLQQRVELKQKMQRTPEGQRAELEGRLLEVERNLEEQKRMLEQSAKGRELLVKLRQETIADEDARVREEKEKLEAEEQLKNGNRKARMIYHLEPSYPSDAREKKIEGAVVLALYRQSRRNPAKHSGEEVSLSFLSIRLPSKRSANGALSRP